MFVNSSRSHQSSIHRSFFEDSSNFRVFLHFAFGRRLRRQLTCQQKADKSSSPFNLSSSSWLSIAIAKISCSKLGLTLSVVIFLALLLIWQGIEPNPGPQRPDARSGTAASVSVSSLVLTTQNCRGLTNPSKLISIIRKAYGSPNSSRVLCLQETHQINRFALDNHFKGTAVIDNGERAQRGTAILVPEGLSIGLSRVSGEGRWSLAAIKDSKGNGSEQTSVIASVYAPNCHRETIEFFEGFFAALDEFCDDVAELSPTSTWPNVIIAGDFNFVFDPDLDSLNRLNSQNESSLASLVGGYLEEKGMTDCLLYDPQPMNRYTWRRGSCCSRLDYIFASGGLSSRIASCNTEWYAFGSNYDHASVSITIKEKVEIPKGRGYPKLFKNDISSIRSVTWLKARLEESRNQIPNHWNPHQVHEFLKMTIRSAALELRAMNRVQSSSQVIKDKINSMIQNPTREALLEVDRLKVELLQAEESEAELLSIKAGVKWREQGEKSSKYFLGRLKSRVLAKEIHSLVDTSGAVLRSLESVMEHVKSFYSNLYKANIEIATSTPRDDFFEHCPALDPVQRQQLANPITLDELKNTLKSCQDSAPGLDGIPYSYYKTFDDTLLPSLLDSWNFAISTGELAQSHLQSCLTLLPKKIKI